MEGPVCEGDAEGELAGEQMSRLPSHSETTDRSRCRERNLPYADWSVCTSAIKDRRLYMHMPR